MTAVSFLDGGLTGNRVLPGDGLGWLKARREAGAERFGSLGLPTQKLESWKYTRLRPLDDTAYTPIADEADATEVKDLPGIGDVAGRLVFVNGKLRQDLSDVKDLPKGVRFGSLEDLLTDDPEWAETHLGAVIDDTDQAMLALNDAMMDSGFVLHVAKGVALTKPLEVVYVGGLTDRPVAYFPRNLIVIDANAQATLVKHHVGRGVGAYFANAATEIDVADGAIFKHYKVQAESLQATHVTTEHARVGRDATYECFQLSIGGLLSRTESRITLAGEGAHCGFNGAYMMRGKEHCDNTSYIDMAVPHTTCKQVYKGVLDDEARAVFQGKINVARNAQKADGRMLNKTLLLSDSAEIDIKPELEIYADDVQCAHGATTGQLDQTALFYLRSRGIPEALARNMLVRSFLGDALDEITDEHVRDVFMDRVVHWLPAHCFLAGEWKESA
ncbi:MAG: Fe-S cluster assembly protein SufD [Rhodospirillales bacterium]